MRELSFGQAVNARPLRFPLCLSLTRTMHAAGVIPPGEILGFAGALGPGFAPQAEPEQQVGHGVPAEPRAQGMEPSWVQAGGKALSRAQEPCGLFPHPGPCSFHPR